MSEYIDICKIKNFCSYYADNASFNKIIDKTNSLKRRYEHILFRIGYIDLSFSILKKDMIENVDGIYFDNDKAKNLLYRCKKSIYNYEIELTKKMKKLMLNEFEISFIENFG